MEMKLRKGVNLFLIVFGITVIASFASGGYLIMKRYEPVKRTREAVRSSGFDKERLQELLKAASDNLEEHKIEQALITYREILSEGPSLEAQLGLARGELLAGREELAAKEYERVLRLERKNPTAVLELGRIYSHRQETWDQAETKFKDLLEVDPDHPEALLGLARVLAWRGKAAQACEIFGRPVLANLMTQQDQRDYAIALLYCWCDLAGHLESEFR